MAVLKAAIRKREVIFQVDRIRNPVFRQTGFPGPDTGVCRPVRQPLPAECTGRLHLDRPVTGLWNSCQYSRHDEFADKENQNKPRNQSSCATVQTTGSGQFSLTEPPESGEVS
jgi:hypothetical protein